METIKKGIRLILVLLLLFSLFFTPPYSVVAKNTTELSFGYFTENKGQWDASILFIGTTSTGKITITKNQFGLNTELIGAELLPYYNNYFIGNDPTKWGTHCRNFKGILGKNSNNGDEFTYYLTNSGLCRSQTPDDSLIFSTYLGGSDKDYSSSIAVDALGNSYVTGWTYSSNFSTTPGIDRDFNYYNDAYLVKLGSAGQLLYSTFLGGWYEDSASAITLDSSGNIYLAGETRSFDFPMTTGYDRFVNGVETDAFVIKLSNDGSEILYSTYLGGKEQDSVTSIAVDKEGHAFVTGYTESGDFPMTQTHEGTNYAPGYCQKLTHFQDSFIVKLNSSGEEIIYSTLLGSNLVY